MKPEPTSVPKDDGEEIFALVETLHRTERRLEELTAGQVDSVVDRQGQTFFLRRAQEELRSSEAVRQASILNALPAQIALLDTQGVIASVNESWRRFATLNSLQGPGFGVGQNYVEICERVVGDCSDEARAAAKGIRQVLRGKEKEFALEYPCHSLTEKCWFRLVVTPVNSDRLAGAVVMHVNITARKLADEQLRSKTALFEAMVHSSPDGITIVDSKNRKIVQNQRLIDLWKMPADVADQGNAEQRLAWFIAQVKDPGRFAERGTFLLEHQDEIGRDEIEFLDGRFFERYSSPIKDKDGKYYGRIWCVREITERKLGEEQLSSKTALLEAQLNSTLDGILIVDSEGKTVLQNHRMIDLWNQPAEIANEIDHRRRLEWITRQVKNSQRFSERVAYLYDHPNEIGRDELELINGKYFDRYTAPVIGRDGKHFGRIWAYRDITTRKRAEEQLSSKTALLEAQLNSTPDVIIIVDSEGKLMLQNRKMIDLWNPPQEIFDELDHRKRLEWVAGQVVSPRQFSERVAYLYAHPDEIGRDELELVNGKVFDRYVAPVIDRNGKYFGRIWAYHDITERKQAAQKLEDLSRRTKRRERLLSTALASMSDFAQIYDQAGRILFVNQPLLDLWGFTLEEVVGKNFYDLGYPKELAEKLHRQLRDIFETGQEVTDETPYTSPTGVRGFYEYIFSPAFSTDGKVDFVVGSTRDVTQRKAAEVEIRFNEQRYRSLVEATTAIVWDTPASGEFTSEQPGWTAFTGQSFDELRGWGWLNAVHPEDRDETAQVWSAAIASRSRYDVEHRLQISDKTYRNMLVRAVPILGEDGTIRQWIGIHTDITERKKLESQFLRAQRMESIGTLAGGIAHDLNNSLAPIMMSIELLRMKFTDPESQEVLATLSASAQRGADMVRQVLSFARGVEGRHMEVQVGHVIKDVEKIANDTFLKHIQVRTIIGRDLWTIMGDPTQVHQVLLNLCVNARDAMPDGGTLTLSAENILIDEHYAGFVAEAQPGPYLVLQVEDTGSGMPAGVIEKIFDPFFTTKEIGKGTGLGLSTSLAIVKSHGGFMRVYSEPGKGTKFKVYFPARPEVSTETEVKIAAEMPRGNGEIILLVDDEASVRHITQQTLQAFGYRVILASDGVEAVSIFSRQGPEIAVVLTDMMMPVMDGPALIRVLRKLKPTLPIIGASGLSATQGGSQSGSLGPNYFLPKPYMANELLKILRDILTVKPQVSRLHQ